MAMYDLAGAYKYSIFALTAGCSAFLHRGKKAGLRQLNLLVRLDDA